MEGSSVEILRGIEEMGFEARTFLVFANGGSEADIGDTLVLFSVDAGINLVYARCGQSGGGRQGDIGGREPELSGKFLTVFHGTANGERIAKHGVGCFDVSFGQQGANTAGANSVVAVVQQIIHAGTEAALCSGGSQEIRIARAAFTEMPVAAY